MPPRSPLQGSSGFVPSDAPATMCSPREGGSTPRLARDHELTMYGAIGGSS